MQRLIDLDKMMTIYDEDNNAVIFGNLEAAEVKAIPVEWLMKKADEYASMEVTKNGEPYMFTMQEVAGMIILLAREGRKENETNADR